MEDLKNTKNEKVVLLISVYFPNVGLVEANTILTNKELSLEAMTDLVKQHAAVWKTK